MTDLDRVLRPSINQLEAYNSGLSLSAVRDLYGLTTVTRLASNENPHGPAPEVLEHIRRGPDQPHLYPSSDVGTLRQSLARYLSANGNRLIFGNGSEELLSIICRTVINPGDRVITLYPSFPLHEDYAALMGANVERLHVSQDLAIDVDALLEAVNRPAKLLIFTNPSNPVGSWIKRSDLEAVIEAKHPDTLLVLDEAYFEFATGSDYCGGLDVLRPGSGHWVVLRTFSKAWGLAGLRIGYGVCSSGALKSALELAKTPFNVNALAQSAAALALANEAYMKTCVAKIVAERERVYEALAERELRVARSQANFLFFETRHRSVDVADALIRQGTIVKPWKQAEYENFVRVSIGTRSENDSFLERLDRSKCL